MTSVVGGHGWGLNGGVVRQPSHGRHSPGPRLPDPHHLGAPARSPGFREAVAAGQLLRVLFLDREGRISAQPHYAPRAEALILASNQQRVLGPQARVHVL
jgi:hypothetical protein